VRGGLQTEQKLLRTAQDELHIARLELAGEGVAARAVAFVSTRPGEQLAQLAESEEVDLVLVDGSRPLVGGGVPRGDVGVVLERAPADVAVLVAGEGQRAAPGAGRPVLVPFGGQEHDWAALELGAWIASATGAELQLLGMAGQTTEQSKVQRVLDDAGMLVRQFTSIEPQSVIAEAGAESVLEAASGAGLLVIGLSERWRREGLGPMRSEIARSGVAPTLFVRRGRRPGALAPRDDVTRFSWSSAGMSGIGGLDR
jgi:hypothetical protein